MGGVTQVLFINVLTGISIIRMRRSWDRPNVMMGIFILLRHLYWDGPWAPSQYPKNCLFVRSRYVSKPRDLYLELSDRSEIWQALQQHGCRCACQISKRYDSLKYQSRGFETLRDLTKRRLFGYWDGAQLLSFESHSYLAAAIAVTLCCTKTGVW